MSVTYHASSGTIRGKKQQPGDQLKGGAFSTGCWSVFGSYYAALRCKNNVFRASQYHTCTNGVVCLTDTWSFIYETEGDGRLLHRRSLEPNLKVSASAFPSRVVSLPSTEIQGRGNKGN